MWAFRSIRENSSDAERKAAEEKENQHQEVYSEPVL